MAHQQATTQDGYRRPRSVELRKMRKADLCALYRRLGGLGGIHPPEKWTKDEVINSITEMEWDRLPDDRKLPDPPRLTPPCDDCGLGEQATPHGRDGDHNYRNTYDPGQGWVPESEQEAERLEQLAKKAAAPAPVDVTKPHQFRVDRADGYKDWSFSHGSSDGTTDHINSVGLAQAEAAATRTKHSYYGPLTVYVWQRQGDGTHYRDPVPAHAERFDFPPQPLFDPRRRRRQLGAVD